MNITEIRVKLVGGNAERLRAFCSMTLDGDFVIRDLKVIDGTNGPFVAMPSRKLTDRCPKCGGKNHLRARHCNDCGGPLKEDRLPRDADRRAKLHADVAHPINAACREEVQGALIKAYEEELERAGQPGYQPQSLEEDEGMREEDKGMIEEDKGVREGAEATSPSDYDELVADLNKTASQRGRGRGATTPTPDSPDPIEGLDDLDEVEPADAEAIVEDRPSSSEPDPGPPPAEPVATEPGEEDDGFAAGIP